MSMQNIISLNCPKCNNNNSKIFYKYGKDKDGYQKFQCRKCYHQFAPERTSVASERQGRTGDSYRKYPSCPICNKASFLHHDYEHYSNYRCSDKKCNHPFFACKNTAIQSPSMTNLFGKEDFKRMRYPVFLIITALSMFYLGKNSFRNIALILRVVHNIKVSHTTISNWCTKFAPVFDNMRIQLLPMLDLNSDEWHTDETVIKISGHKYYIWFIIDSETRFIIGFHLSPFRNSQQAFSLFKEAKAGTKAEPKSIVSDRYAAYKIPVKSIFNNSVHIRVESFKDEISNNLIECFNKQFKAWYKTKQGFSSFKTANNLISIFVFFFNFVRPHSALNNYTPAQVAGLELTKKQKKQFLLVA